MKKETLSQREGERVCVREEGISYYAVVNNLTTVLSYPDSLFYVYSCQRVTTGACQLTESNLFTLPREIK